METQPILDNQLTVIDKSLEIFKGGSAILREHGKRSTKALAVGNSLLGNWALADQITDEDQKMAVMAELDSKSNDFLVKCSNAKREMEQARKPITQMMDVIVAMYTAEEAKMDPKKSEIPQRIQGKRNLYAVEQDKISKRKAAEAEARAAKNKERVEAIARINNEIADGNLNLMMKKKMSMQASFNSITLDTYDTKYAQLLRMSCELPVGTQHVPVIAPSLYRHTPDEAFTLLREAIDAYPYDQFFVQYEQQIRELKQSLIDRAPAKKQELQEAEDARLLAEENRKKQEKADQELRDAKNKKDREAAIARQKQLDDERVAAAERQRKADEERELREKAEALRLQEENEKLQQQIAEKKDLEVAAGHAESLFDQVVETASNGSAPIVKTGFNIVVNHPVGWVELFNFWYTREGVKMPLDDFETKTLKQIKTFAENVAKKTDEKIESKYLVYESTTKAINKKAKV